MVPSMLGWARTSSFHAASWVCEVGVGPWPWGPVGCLPELALMAFFAVSAAGMLLHFSRPI